MYFVLRNVIPDIIADLRIGFECWHACKLHPAGLLQHMRPTKNQNDALELMATYKHDVELKNFLE